jgi:hypothetical protein
MSLCHSRYILTTEIEERKRKEEETAPLIPKEEMKGKGKEERVYLGLGILFQQIGIATRGCPLDS